VERAAFIAALFFLFGLKTAEDAGLFANSWPDLQPVRTFTVTQHKNNPVKSRYHELCTH
jgi:hypothetical protein